MRGDHPDRVQPDRRGQPSQITAAGCREPRRSQPDHLFCKGGYANLTVRAAGNTYLTTIYEGVHTAVLAITR